MGISAGNKKMVGGHFISDIIDSDVLKILLGTREVFSAYVLVWKTKTFSYTGADQVFEVPEDCNMTIECWGAGSNNAYGGYAKGVIPVTKGQKLSFMIGGKGSRTDNGTTYGFGGSTTYGGRGGGGLSGVFTGDTAIGANDASRVLVIAGGAGGGISGGGAGGGENGQNGNGGSYGYPGAGGTQTGRGNGGNTRSEQFRGGGGSGTYGFGGGGGWRGGNGSGGDGSGDDDAQGGGGSGYVLSSATDRVLTQGGGSAAGQDGSVKIRYLVKERPQPRPTVRLPYEYQEVEYIESTGTQWIDSGYIPKSTSGFEMKFRNISAINTYRTLIGTRTDTSTAAFWIGWMNNKCYMEMSPANIEYTRSDGWFNTGIDYEMSFLNKTLICNGETFQSGTNFTQDSVRNLYIFAGNSNGQTQPFEAAASRMYYLKLYEGENLVRDFVPCYRRIDRVGGMYDLVTNTFYANAGTGVFTLGGEVRVPELPGQYEEVTYLESSATQYIDTGYKPTVNTEIGTRLAWGGTQEYWAVFYGVTGNDTAPDGILGRLFYSSDRGAVTTYNRWFCNSDYAECQQTTANANVFHDIYSKKNYSKLDSATPTITTTGTPYQGNIYMFCGNNGGSAWRFSRCKIASFLIAESGTLVRYMVPCKRKADGEPGFYDLINGVFYTNQGTGVFSCGPSIRYRCTDKTLLYMPVSGDDTSSVVRDNSKGMNNGTWYGTAGYNTLASGKKVLSFSGSQGLYLGNRLISSQPYTIAMWVKKGGNQTNNATIVSNQYDSGHHGQVIAFNDSNKVYTFYGDGTNWVDTSALVTLENNIWYQYTVTVDGKVIKKYVNNVLVQTVTNSNPPVFTSSTAFSIGFLRTNGSDTNYRFFVGNIADLIVEIGERSADKRTDFFEATKADYGVS